MRSPCDADVYPPFEARFPWLGADLQTLRNTLSGALHAPSETNGSERGERVYLPLRDGSGDVLHAWLDRGTEWASQCSGKPLMLLLHGLGGCESSSYMQTSARHFVRLGFPVLRLNFRGAGPSRATCRFQYHAGRTADLADVLRVLQEDRPELMRNGVVLAGFSLGGNLMLKFLAEYGADFSVRAAASVSAPIQLGATAEQMLCPRNFVYQRYLLRKMKVESLADGAELTDAERQAVLRSRSVYEFDDVFVAPRNGYRDARHYYGENSSCAFLGAISCPTLMIHAKNDPWVPASAYEELALGSSPHLQMLLASSGGHLGFHARGSRAPWHDRCIEHFFRERGAA